MNAAKQRLRRRSRQESEIVIQRVFVYVGRDRRMLQDRLDFRSEDEPAVLLIEVKRLYAGAIARQHQPFTIRVPDRDSEIAFNVVDEIEAALFVEMQNGFGIRARSVNVASLLEVFAQRSVVVNLAIENQPHTIRAALHRLMPSFC